MYIKTAVHVSAQPVPEAPGTTIRWLWGTADGAPSFSLRLLEVPPGGASPFHAHPFEHEVYILSGNATLKGADNEYPLHPGDTALVLPNEIHQFVNAGAEPLRFLCAIPNPKG